LFTSLIATTDLLQQIEEPSERTSVGGPHFVSPGNEWQVFEVWKVGNLVDEEMIMVMLGSEMQLGKLTRSAWSKACLRVKRIVAALLVAMGLVHRLPGNVASREKNKGSGERCGSP